MENKILKIFSYFNQLGDGFFKQLSDLGIKNENLEHEFKYLYNTHYFNILLCGRSGTGKSTFINTIMGEKKSFTLQYESAGTYRSNYFIGWIHSTTQFFDFQKMYFYISLNLIKFWF